ncbi:MAG TPA: aminodeoxychorismate/anthranilate synthase component II [Flavobacteriales bacterium]|nr:aminodeoxychorismate/anthranilate synthase component II [Flavobacteriales bacterium]HRE75929.1 aminodeoxychorismate/anthranilate synthase component II [Flavobacteriales bacterium]HRE97960.1 aminodeoxychorismate/anthranilate synthase component II [Flavobacteriales bacterium]HRJ35550.1 aminodeoxychorismate/anthranilate synthase component II [Flavobacteriales bacterium]HRJ39107.1 aminodeoxychorismate/anthranilate synthase component II [Flavobacteriales bacterium]
MRIFLLDNYDSFTWNLEHYLQGLGAEVEVRRNNEVDVEFAASFDRIVLSPGPGLPKDSGILMDVIKRYQNEKPILGVCLGLQAIAIHFGAQLRQLDKVAHGVSTSCSITDFSDPLFAGLPPVIEIGRYHSWVVDEKTLPAELIITSEDERGHIMSLRHRKLPIHAVQFHPESVLTPHGKKILRNWMDIRI